MSTSAVTRPPGFELERGEHLAVTPPPGFELEDQTSKGSIQLPPGFELVNQTSQDSIQLPPGFELELPAHEKRTSSGTLLQSSSNPNAVQRQTDFGVSAQPRRANVVRATGTRFSDVTSRFGQARDAAGFAPGPPSASWRSTHPPYTDSSGQLHTMSGDKSDDQIYRESQASQPAVGGFFKQAAAAAHPVAGPPQVVTHRNYRIKPGFSVAKMFGGGEWERAEDSYETIPPQPPPAPSPAPAPPQPAPKSRELSAEDQAFLDRRRNPHAAAEHEPVPHWDPVTGYPMGEVAAVKAKYDQAAGKYVEWTPREREILDKLQRIDQSTSNALDIANRWAVQPFEKMSEKGRRAGETVAEDLYGEAGPQIEGVAKGVLGTAGGMIADPRMWPFMLAAPETGAEERFFSRAANPTLQRAATAGFAGQMGVGTVQQVAALRSIWNDPNFTPDQKYEALTSILIGALMAAHGSKSSLRGEPLLNEQVARELDKLPIEAKQQVFDRLQAKLDSASFETPVQQSPPGSQKPPQRTTPAVQGPIVTSGAQPGSMQFKAGDYVQSLTDGRDGTVERVLPRLGLAQVRTRTGKIQAMRLSKLAHRLVSRTGEWEAATYDVLPIRKGQPTQQEAAILGRAPRRPAQGTGKSRDFQIKTCGPMETLIQGGGEEVWADDLERSDGMARDAKYVRKVRRSMYVEGSKIDPEFRVVLERDTVGEFRRYAAVIQDPKSPIRALEVIVSDRASVSYFLKLMKRFGIPGHIVIK